MAKYFIQIVAYVDAMNEKEALHASETIIYQLKEHSIIKHDEDVWVESVEEDTQ